MCRPILTQIDRVVSSDVEDGEPQVMDKNLGVLVIQP